MKRMIRAAAAAAILVGGLGSLGCVHTGKSDEDCRYRNWVDPCYPERYNHAARQAVIAPFAQQVQNGHVLNQTVFNWYFEYASDKLTPAGMEKLDSIARTRPSPDPRIFLQTARDLPPNLDAAKIVAARTDLDLKRAAAVQKYLASEPAFAPVAYEIFVHDPAVPGINAEMGLRSYNGSFQGYRGNISGSTGGAGAGVISTGGGTSLTAPPATGTGR